MKRDTIGIFVGVTALIASSFLAFYLAWGIAGRIGGYQIQEDLIPFNNAHLSEEAAEGTYRIWTDIPFILTTLGTVFVPFLVATVVALKISGRHSAKLVVGVGFISQTWLDHAVFYPYCPWSFRIAFLFILGLGFAGSLLAMGLCGAKSAAA